MIKGVTPPAEIQGEGIRFSWEDRQNWYSSLITYYCDVDFFRTVTEILGQLIGLLKTGNGGNIVSVQGIKYWESWQQQTECMLSLTSYLGRCALNPEARYQVSSIFTSSLSLLWSHCCSENKRSWFEPILTFSSCDSSLTRAEENCFCTLCSRFVHGLEGNENVYGDMRSSPANTVPFKNGFDCLWNRMRVYSGNQSLLETKGWKNSLLKTCS